jgi:hypothetical protein
VIPDLALAAISMCVIFIGIASCIFNVIVWLKISAINERTEKLHETIIHVLRNSKGKRR